MKYLIINADDFGLTRGVSDAILEAHQDGVLTSTTLMVGLPAAAYAMEQARRYPSLGIGLHLTLTAGRPVSPPERVPSLVGRDGRFVKDFNRLALRASRSEIRLEWEAQIRAMLALGRQPTHLDSHHNVHAYPAFAAIAADLARQFGIGAVRVTRPEDTPWQGRYRGVGPLEWAYNHFVARSSSMIDRSGLGRPGHMVGYLADADKLDTERALRIVAHLPEGVAELVSHPGRVDDDLRAITSLQDRRELELATILDPRLRQKLKDEGVKLVTFDALQTKEMILVAPLSGRALPLEQVPDPVFSGKMVGEGAAVEAGAGGANGVGMSAGEANAGGGSENAGKAVLVAPCAGTVTMVHSAGHGVGLVTPAGLELLLHVGIDTVEMGGRGFEPMVSADQRVELGQPLVRFEPDLIRQAGHSLVSPVVVTNPERLESIQLVAEGVVEAGRSPFLRLKVKPVGAD